VSDLIKPSLPPDVVDRMLAEGDELRREAERRTAPMRGPPNPLEEVERLRVQARVYQRRIFALTHALTDGAMLVSADLHQNRDRLSIPEQSVRQMFLEGAREARKGVPHPRDRNRLERGAMPTPDCGHPPECMAGDGYGAVHCRWCADVARLQAEVERLRTVCPAFSPPPETRLVYDTGRHGPTQGTPVVVQKERP
jgi:hypothetical protein